ncbi:MAG: hypothetical protein PVI26_13325 [Chitinispirillia bacterium]|jgi:hypothetical protein
MRQNILILSALLIGILNPVYLAGQNFIVPTVPGGKEVVSQVPNTYNLEYTNTSFNEIIAFYKKEFKDQSEINWKESVSGEKAVINDWGNRKWHKITVLKKGNSVYIEIKKDSWTWILGTLIIRFIGVFIVLIVLMIVLQITGAIFKNIRGKGKISKA